MNESLGEHRLTAHWAVLGKHPGQTMGYEVLRSSLADDRASSYLWRASATGAPSGRDPEGELPWRVFLGSTNTHPEPVCAVVETLWDGATDGTGAPSYTWRLTLFPWAEAGRPALTWSGIDRALPSGPALPDDAVPVTVCVAPTPPAELALLIDQLGFEWAAGVAALLLSDGQVAITPRPGKRLPGVSDRVRVLDAVCSLLPYGCRAWLSAATWTGQAQHDLRLFFASAARTGQITAELGGSPPREPQDEDAQAYLRGLRRLRAKNDTTEIVEYLLSAAEPGTASGAGAAARRVLREADLRDTVVEEIQLGTGEVEDVGRVLARYPAESFAEGELEVLADFLVRRAHDGSREAGRLLKEHWTDLPRQFLLREVLAAGTPEESFERAKRGLGVIHSAVEPDRPGSFDEVFNALVKSPQTTHEWTGTLIYMAGNKWGASTDEADRLLVRESAIGRTWLGLLLKHKDRSLAPLRRLVEGARGAMATDAVPGWLRFAAVLLGDPVDSAVATDAADFAEAVEGGWRITLEIAWAQRRPEVLELMLPGLWRAARTERGLRQAVERLVPVDKRPASAGVAADADLFCGAAVRDGAVPDMPRTQWLDMEDELADYVSVLSRRIRSDGELRGLAIEALAGGEVSRRKWRVINGTCAELPNTFLVDLLELLNRRLNGRGRPIDYRVIPEYLMHKLAERHDMRWLESVRAFEKAARDRAPYPELAAIILEAQGAARGHGRFHTALLNAIADWTLKLGPYGLEQVAYCMDRAAANTGRPGFDLYVELAREASGGELSDLLTKYSESRMDWHERVLAESRGKKRRLWPGGS